ncbi:MAG: cytochrome c [Desulfuromonas sp.]|nr:cytochrome c [Desulfuromonas sp.]
MVLWLVFLTIVLGGPSAVFTQDLNTCLRCHEQCHGLDLLAASHDDVAMPSNCTTCHRGNDQTTRKELAHHFLIGARYAWYRIAQSEAVVDGKKRIEQLACRRCHIQLKQGNLLAINLDMLMAIRSVEELEQALRVPAFYMPDFSLAEDDLRLLVTQILAGGVDAETMNVAQPVVVHFEDEADLEHLFEKNCGSCHRVLTRHLGGLGQGTIAPNLSGLLTRFYPENFKDQQLWNGEGLTKWIKNPRSIRRLTRMPPLRLNDQQIKQLMESTWSQEFGKEH